MGDAIALATDDLRRAGDQAVAGVPGAEAAKSRVMILLTDGANNPAPLAQADPPDPIDAARVAATLGIKIYTIGAGTPEGGLVPVDDPVRGRRYLRVENDIDEEMLQKIASLTGGRYFRATSEGMLATIYQRIGELEKTKIEVKHFTTYEELAPKLMLVAMVLLLLELLAGATISRGLP